MWTLARRLAALGIMGINRRNADFTLVHNPRRLYPLVDNKLETKRIAAQAGIPVPALYGVIERHAVLHVGADSLERDGDYGRQFLDAIDRARQQRLELAGDLHERPDARDEARRELREVNQRQELGELRERRR